MEVRIGKVDIDTVGAGFLIGATREDNVVVIKNCQASEEDLANANIICIEVGGSGRTAENDFDHHEGGGTTFSATKQVADKLKLKADKLVEYIDQIDTKGIQSFALGVEFPTLADVFAGMLLIARDPIEQFHGGIELLSKIVKEGQNSFGTIVGFSKYVEAKSKNNQQIYDVVKVAKWDTTRSGRKLGYLETNFFGAPGALYSEGAEIVVAFAPQFSIPPVPKFTIGGNGIRVDALLPKLNELESGWGGPATGTIIGSPREGSKLSLEQVVDIVINIL